MMEPGIKRFGRRLFGWRHGLGGVVLVEVLVAATVMALGIAGIALTQPVLTASADAARLRAEATRLAQQKLDEFRAFQQVEASADSSVVTFDGSIVDGSDTASQAMSIFNTAFNREWVVCARNILLAGCLADNDRTAQFKVVTVNVTWTDRGGVTESLRLTTVIARADPADLGTLAVGPGAVNLRQPKNRNLDIPFDAVTLPVAPDGKYYSGYQLPYGTGSPYMLFDNVTGRIKNVCTSIDLTTGVKTGCGDDLNAYGLSGYVRICPDTGNCDPAIPAGKAKFSLQSNTATTEPLSFDSSNGPAPAYRVCYSGRQVILSSGGTVVPDTGQADNQIQARLMAYFCVVQPQAVTGNATPPWSGRVTLNADTASGWVISSTASVAPPAQPYKVCRYSADYERTATLHAYCQGKDLATEPLCRMTNNEHPLWYRGVNASLLNQNYLIVKAASACPVMGAATPLNNPAIYINASTATHQTNGNTTDGAELSFTCMTQDCSDKLYIEPSATSTTLVTD